MTKLQFISYFIMMSLTAGEFAFRLNTGLIAF